MVFNLKNPAVEIIDNLVEDKSDASRYGSLPNLMVTSKPILNIYIKQIVCINKTLTSNNTFSMQFTFFCEYLKDINHPKQYQIQQLGQNINRLKLPWGTKHNFVDCGVFIMRHMETYVGNKIRGWNIEIPKESQKSGAQKRQLNELRKRYMAKILLSEHNTYKNERLREIEEWEELTDDDRDRILVDSKKRLRERFSD